MAIHKIKIFTGRDSEYLAKKIAASFGTTLGQSEVLRFSDGEFQPCYNESIRGCRSLSSNRPSRPRTT